MSTSFSRPTLTTVLFPRVSPPSDYDNIPLSYLPGPDNIPLSNPPPPDMTISSCLICLPLTGPLLISIFTCSPGVSGAGLIPPPSCYKAQRPHVTGHVIISYSILLYVSRYSEKNALASE